MEKILKLLDEIVLLVKIHGINAVYWLVVLFYVVGILYPKYSLEMLSASNVIVLGIIWIGVQLINGVGSKKEHSIQNSKRLNSSVEIRQNLRQLLEETHADRAYIMEYHNGKENPTLLPFIYLDMTFEETANKSMNFIHKEYQNMNVSLFNLPMYIAEHSVFTGLVDDLVEIDQKVGRRYQDHGTKYCSIILLKSEGIMIGIMGISYREIPNMSNEEIQAKMAIYAQDISNYLDLAKCDFKKQQYD